MSAAVVPVAVEGEPTIVKNVPPPKSLKKQIAKFMDAGEMQLFLGILLMVSLFMPDAWILGNPSDDANIALDIILILVFVVFALESIVLSLVKDDYLWSFFFWCDIIGTISILLDIQMINSLWTGDDGQASSGALLRAARAAKIGARYGRLMRLLKLMKFMDYMPCFKKNDEDAAEPTMSAARRVSNQLSNILSRRVAFLVLLLVILIPLLNYDLYYASDIDFEAYASSIANLAMYKGSGLSNEVTQSIDAFHKFFEGGNKELLHFELFQGSTKVSEKTFLADYKDKTRGANRIGIEENSVDGAFRVEAIIDKTKISQWNAIFGMLIIVLVIVVLLGGSASFQSAVEKIVVLPLERMMGSLRESAKAILSSVASLDQEEDTGLMDDEDEGLEELETAMLEKMVEKLARIAKHVMPGTAQVIVDENTNVDSATASWLNANYSKGGGSSEIKRNAIVIDSKLQTLKSGVNVSEVNSWSFDVLKYSNEQLFEVNQYMFSVLDLFNTFSIPIPVFEAFLLEMSKRYIDSNTYHNFFHACDVAHTVYRLVMLSELHKILSPLETFSLIIAAISHDVAHPGVNNNFLVKSRDKLAMIHNDRSPLENMHCSLLYEIVRDTSRNIFVGLSDAQWRECRKCITTAILGTDMVHHFDQISKVQIFLEVNGQDVKDFLSGKSDTVECMKENDNRLFLMELFLHAADISNPYKPFVICEKWARLVVEEFHTQGDKEKNNGMDISPMMDRNNTNLYNMQMGFIEFVVAPLVNGFISIFPPLYTAGQNMKDNMIAWGDWRKKEIKSDPAIGDADAECKKLDDRLAKFGDKMAFLKELESFDEARKK